MTPVSRFAESRTPSGRRRPWWALASGYIACVWAILFALANIYLQLGGPGLTGVRHNFLSLGRAVGAMLGALDCPSVPGTLANSQTS